LIFQISSFAAAFSRRLFLFIFSYFALAITLFATFSPRLIISRQRCHVIDMPQLRCFHALMSLSLIFDFLRFLSVFALIDDAMPAVSMI